MVSAKLRLLPVRADVSPSMAKARTYLLLAPLLALALVGGFSRTHEPTFDDRFAYAENADVVAEGAGGWEAWMHDFWGAPMESNSSHKSYRPVTVLAFRYLHRAGRGSFVPFRVASAALHAANALLVGAVTPSTDDAAGLGAALLFAVHPAHVDATSGAVGLAELLATNLALLAAIAERHAVLAVLFAGAAALSKETGAMVLPLLATTSALRRKPLRALTYALAFAAYVAARVWLSGTSGHVVRIQRLVENPLAFIADGQNASDSQPHSVLRAPSAAPRVERALNIAVLHGRYLNTLLFPHRLSADHSFACHAIPRLDTLLDEPEPAIALATASLGYALALASLLRARTRLTPALEAMLWFAIPFLPSANVLFYVGTYLAERVLYLPSSGFAMLFGLGAARIHRSLKVPLAILLVPVVVPLAVAMLRHQAAWANDDALFRAAGAACPRSAKVQLNLGILARREANTTRAIRHFDEAASIAGPTYCEATYWRGLARLDAATDAGGEVKRLGKALRLLHKALACRWSTKEALSALNAVSVSMSSSPHAARLAMQGWAVALSTAHDMCDAEGAGCVEADLPTARETVRAVPLRLQSCRYLFQAQTTAQEPAAGLAERDLGFSRAALEHVSDVCIAATPLLLARADTRSLVAPVLAAAMGEGDTRVAYTEDHCVVLRDALHAAVLHSDGTAPPDRRRAFNATFVDVEGNRRVQIDAVRLALYEYLGCLYALEGEGAEPWHALHHHRTAAPPQRDGSHRSIVHAVQAANAYDPWLHVEWARVLLETSRKAEARAHLEACASLLRSGLGPSTVAPPWGDLHAAPPYLLPAPPLGVQAAEALADRCTAAALALA